MITRGVCTLQKRTRKLLCRRPSGSYIEVSMSVKMCNVGPWATNIHFSLVGIEPDEVSISSKQSGHKALVSLGEILVRPGYGTVVEELEEYALRASSFWLSSFFSNGLLILPNGLLEGPLERLSLLLTGLGRT